MRGSAGVLAALVGVTVVSGCGSAPADRPPVAEVAAEVDCLADDVLTTLGGVPPAGDPRPAPARGSVPDGFQPDRVVECRTGPVEVLPAPLTLVPPGPDDLTDGESALQDALRRPASTPDAGAPALARVQEVTRDGDLTALLAALRRPSHAPDPDRACPAVGYLLPEVFLVDAAGRAVRPVWPRDACSMPLPGTSTALDALEETAVRDLERTAG